jgi:hypothetical protein
MSFNVDLTGVPVLVNTSYFPNWQVSGARGPYRVTPNLMVVIPTSQHITMTYGYTTLDKFGYGLSFVGLIGLVVLWRIRPVDYSAARFRGRHATSGPPPPDPNPPNGLTDPWSRLGSELGDGASVDGAGRSVNLSTWLDHPDLASSEASVLPPSELPTLDLPTEPAVEEHGVPAEPASEAPAATEAHVVTHEPAAEEPMVEEPMVEEPMVEEPMVEEPMVEEPMVEEPMVEEPMVEEPAGEIPATPAGPAPAEEPKTAPKWGILPDQTFPKGFLGGGKGRRR